MTNEEAARVLDGRPSEAVRALVAQAQGWPALIGLAALSATAEVPSERMSEGLFRYFAEEVFRREPEEIQRFMLLASVPHSVNAEIAREVLESSKPTKSLIGSCKRACSRSPSSTTLRSILYCEAS